MLRESPEIGIDFPAGQSYRQEAPGALPLAVRGHGFGQGFPALASQGVRSRQTSSASAEDKPLRTPTRPGAALMATDPVLPAPPRKTWKFRAISEERLALAEREFGLTRLAARLLAGRDLSDSASVESFLNPALLSLHDPMEMRDMDRAVERIARALAEGERIAVYGDYDVDGLTATALLVRFFKWLGVDVLTHIPHRLNEGYGMSVEGIDALHARGARLIITVDNGIGCVDEIARARDLGVDVIVTDHHQPGAKLPDATAVIDPSRPDCPYPFKHLSGVGVAFKLAHAAAKGLGKPSDEAKVFLKSLLDLVALGTIADVVPLLGENRVFAFHGLKALEQTEKAGLRAMIELLGVKEKRITGETVAFLLGPRLNAAGRTGDAGDSLELLLSDDAARARQLSKFLDRLNEERRSREGEVLTEAFEILRRRPELLTDPIVVAAGEGWHLGIVGIVASRLVDRFGRPALVLGIEDGVARGSARGVEGFDLCEALTECAEFLTTYGGHKLAAGLSLPCENLDAFRRAINRVAAEKLGPDEWAPALTIDASAKVDELTQEALHDIDRMRPFGHGNPSPVVALTGCELAAPPLTVGGKHLKMRLAQPEAPSAEAGPLTAIWFRCPEHAWDLVRNSPRIDVAGTPRRNEWQGRESVEMTIRDIRPCDGSR